MEEEQAGVLERKKHAEKKASNFKIGMVLHPLNLDKPDVEDKGGVWWDDLPHSSVAIAKVRRDSDSPAFPQAHVGKPTVHACNDPTVSKGYDVRRVVVEAVEEGGREGGREGRGGLIHM